MNQFHDPVRQENYLRQCLAHDKKPLGILLGAGAPMAIRVITGEQNIPLIPDICEMTKQICAVLTSGSLSASFELVNSHFIDDGKPNPSIEDILTHIRSLRQVVGTGEVRGLNASEITNLDDAICNEINNIVNKSLSGTNSPYHKLAAWIGAISRTQAVEIFTTNYDLLMEQALEEFRIPYFDGFVGARFTFFDPYAIEDDRLPARWARLWKLHGSINWLCDENGLVYRSMFYPNPSQRRVIHPSHLKYDESRKMPYLALIDRMKAFIKTPSSLLMTCGYSFRDQHLNETMIQGLQGNPNAIIFALLYGELENYPEAIQLAHKCPNLSLLAKDEAIIGTKRTTWIEKSRDDAGSDTVAVKWVEGDIGDLVKANFNLGDYNNLGNFLEDIIGEDRKGLRVNE